MSTPPQPLNGYEEVAFYGIDSPGELAPEKGAQEHAAKYIMAYVHATEEGFHVFANLRVEKTVKSKEIQDWFNTPIEVHIERWKRESGR